MGLGWGWWLGWGWAGVGGWGDVCVCVWLWYNWDYQYHWRGGGGEWAVSYICETQLRLCILLAMYGFNQGVLRCFVLLSQSARGPPSPTSPACQCRGCGAASVAGALGTSTPVEMAFNFDSWSSEAKINNMTLTVLKEQNLRDILVLRELTDK